MENAPTPVSPSRAWTNHVWRIARLLLIPYLFVMLGCSMLQEWLIFPGHAMQGQKYTQIRPTPDSELVQLKTAHGDQIYVLFGKAMNADGSIRADSATRPTIIFFYGNGMSLSDTIGICRGWRKLGANVLGVEYPGYGMSSGKPGEAPFYAAADAAYDWLVARTDINKTKIIPTGLSLGTGVAIDLASRKPAAGLVLFSPYTSLSDLARSSLPWIPTGLILRHHFPNDKKIGSVMPILMAHGRNDSIIPSEMTERLAKAATRAQVTTVLVDTDHNDLFELAGEELTVELSKLIERVNSEP